MDVRTFLEISKVPKKVDPINLQDVFVVVPAF